MPGEEKRRRSHRHPRQGSLSSRSCSYRSVPLWTLIQPGPTLLEDLSSGQVRDITLCEGLSAVDVSVHSPRFNCNQNLLPLPRADSTPTRPPILSTAFCTIARPMPVPGYAVCP